MCIRDRTAGLAAKDLAMSVVLPELDGRLYAGVISFKADHIWHEKTHCRIVTYKSVDDRVEHVAGLAAAWIKLRNTPLSQKRVAIVLANYPNKDGRIANGVGYDTPASTIEIMRVLGVEEIPANGNALIESLQANRTNAASTKMSALAISVERYKSLFATLPQPLQHEVILRWGDAGDDPFVVDDTFQLPFLAFGNVVVGIQPARGYNIDPKATYHDPALVPPHNYLAAYLWLRHEFGVQAIIHNGKHGNLEWLPGKSVGLSQSCYPQAILGPVPHIYPFIVNDPGEGLSLIHI
jgi:cobaltochelatase CobN